jgi:hypothetical protein
MTARHQTCVLITALTLLTGCGSSSTAAATGTTESASVIAPTRAVGAAAGPNDDDAVLASPGSPAMWDAASERAAVSAAVAALHAFTDHTRAALAWWRQLQPLLSQPAAVAYTGTDPHHIPTVTITGPGKLSPGTSAYLAEVTVPTSGGTWTVLLSRTGQDSPWLVERFTLPAGSK